MGPTHNRSVAIAVDADHGRRLQANVDGETQRGHGQHAEDHCQEHGAVRVSPEHAVVLVILRVPSDLRKLRHPVYLTHLLFPSSPAPVSRPERVADVPRHGMWNVEPAILAWSGEGTPCRHGGGRRRY